LKSVSVPEVEKQGEFDLAPLRAQARKLAGDHIPTMEELAT